MAKKISINQIHADQPLAQVKTGEIFIVQMIDLSSKKVTIANEAGEEKVVSKATLERWYRELTDEELQKWNESSNDEGAEEASGGGGNGETIAEEDTQESIEQPEPTSGEDTEESEQSSEEGVASPITPSNAGKDKDKAKTKKETEAAKKNAALMKVRQTIIDTILADSDSIQLKKTGGYDVLKEKHNFAEITRGTNRFNVSVMSKCLTEDQINKVKINPASFGWSIDADFTVFDEGDIETAVQLIRQSREYRLAHPVTRKKKEKATEKAEGKGTK